MAFTTIVKKVLDLGATLLPLLKDSPAAPILAIGEKLLELVDKAQEVLHEDDAAKLAQLREELEPLVMDHADKTSAKLKGSAAPPPDPG